MEPKREHLQTPRIRRRQRQMPLPPRWRLLRYHKEYFRARRSYQLTSYPADMLKRALMRMRCEKLLEEVLPAWRRPSRHRVR